MYKIIRISTHSGENKPDPTNRIGRIMDIDPNTIIIGRSFYMDCVFPGMLKSMITSPVVEWKYTKTGLRVMTLNSIYDFEEVRDGDTTGNL